LPPPRERTPSPPSPRCWRSRRSQHRDRWRLLTSPPGRGRGRGPTCPGDVHPGLRETERTEDDQLEAVRSPSLPWRGTATRMRTEVSPSATSELTAPSERRPAVLTASPGGNTATSTLTVSRESTPTPPACPALTTTRTTCRTLTATTTSRTLSTPRRGSGRPCRSS